VIPLFFKVLLLAKKIKIEASPKDQLDENCWPLLRAIAPIALPTDDDDD
jgi:hypothetical protein